MTKAVDLVSNFLGNTGRAVYSIDQLTREGLGVALAGRQIVVVMVEAGMESTIGWGNTRYIIEGRVQRRCCC